MHVSTYTIQEGQEVPILYDCNIRLWLGPDLTRRQASNIYDWFVRYYEEIEVIETFKAYVTDNIHIVNSAGEEIGPFGTRDPWGFLINVAETSSSSVIRLHAKEIIELAIPKPRNCVPRQTRAISGFVYILQAGDLFKIGKAQDLHGRISCLGVKLPIPSILFGAIKSDDYTVLEKHLHSVYAAQRKQGEWFALTDLDLRQIERMEGFFRPETPLLSEDV